MREAWGLILQHGICQDLGLVCRLLCTSKALRAAVDAHCTGLIPVHGEVDIKWCRGDLPAQQQQFEQFTQLWLPKHGHVIKHLLLEPGRGAAAIAAGLQQAAASHGLFLQSYENWNAMEPDLVILQQLPPSHLTQLDLSMGYRDADTQYQQGVAAALARLTRLRELELRGGGADEELLVQGVSGLNRLTHVRLDSPACVGLLPPCVQLLEVGEDESSEWLERAPLHMGHITAATQLKSYCQEMGCMLSINEHDVLPPNLELLELRSCPSTAPLLALKQLRQLKIGCWGSPPPAAELVLLSTLKQLTAVQFDYGYDVDDDPIEPQAAAWAVLPVVKLDHMRMCDADVLHLGRLQSLTSLGLEGGHLQHSTPGQLASALAQLTGLQELELSDILAPTGDVDQPHGEGDEDGPPNRPGVEQLMQAVGRLPHLRSLAISQTPLLAGAAAHLTAATLLTRLCLHNIVGMNLQVGCGLDDYNAISIVYHLPGLRSLDLSGHEQLTDAVLPVIARELQHLEQLVIGDAAVTEKGVQWLTALRHLEGLYVDGVPAETVQHVLDTAKSSRQV